MFSSSYHQTSSVLVCLKKLQFIIQAYRLSYYVVISFLIIKICILGTLITEFDSGKILCSELFSFIILFIFLLFSIINYFFSVYFFLISGTLITEFDDGKILCSELFCSEERVNQVVEALVGIAKAYDLHGWLINVENELPLSQVHSSPISIKKGSKWMAYQYWE